MTFNNVCGCIVDYCILESAIREECARRNIIPKDRYKIYDYRGYAGISLKHDKVSIHRIIGKYMVGYDCGEEISVHHIDGNKMNDEISNLQVLRKELHTKEHYIVQYENKEKLKKNALLAIEKIKRHDVTKENVLELRNKGMTIPQIAAELNCGINTVNRRLGMKA